jgi:hypothetical protein
MGLGSPVTNATMKKSANITAMGSALFLVVCCVILYGLFRIKMLMESDVK